MKKLAYFLLIASGCLWGFIGFFQRHIVQYNLLQPEMTFCQISVAATALGLFILFTDKSRFKIKLKDIWCFLGTGMLSMLCLNLCYLGSMRYTTLAVSSLLLSTAPAYVIILSAILFKEKITVQKISALVMMLTGCVLMTGVYAGELSVSAKGLFLGVMSGVAYAMYSIFSRFAINRGYASETISFYTFVFAGLGSLPLVDFAHLAGIMNYNVAFYELCMGVICCAAPYILYTKGLEKVETSLAAILATSEPVTAALVGIIIFHEPMGWHDAAGMLLIVSSIVVININKAFFQKKHLTKA